MKRKHIATLSALALSATLAAAPAIPAQAASLNTNQKALLTIWSQICSESWDSEKFLQEYLKYWLENCGQTLPDGTPDGGETTPDADPEIPGEDGGNDEDTEIPGEDGGSDEDTEIPGEDGDNDEDIEIPGEDGDNDEDTEIPGEDGDNDEDIGIPGEDGGSDEDTEIPGEDDKVEIPGNDQNTPETPDQGQTDSTNNTAFAQQVVTLVNAERAKEGLAPLTMDAKLSDAALIRAKETQISFSHTRPNGTSFSTVLAESGISYRGAGENIAYGQQTPEAVVTAWMNSPGHRANIMNASYTTIGVGCYMAGNTPYWAQLFIY